MSNEDKEIEDIFLSCILEYSRLFGGDQKDNNKKQKCILL
jgi:hypothetical protein